MHREVQKAELSVFDISSAIITRVESMPESMDYFYAGLVIGFVLSMLPSFRRFNDHFGADVINSTVHSLLPDEITLVVTESFSDVICKIINLCFGATTL